MRLWPGSSSIRRLRRKSSIGTSDFGSARRAKRLWCPHASQSPDLASKSQTFRRDQHGPLRGIVIRNHSDRSAGPSNTSGRCDRSAQLDGTWSGWYCDWRLQRAIWGRVNAKRLQISERLYDALRTVVRPQNRQRNFHLSGILFATTQISAAMKRKTRRPNLHCEPRTSTLQTGENHVGPYYEGALADSSYDWPPDPDCGCRFRVCEGAPGGAGGLPEA